LNTCHCVCTQVFSGGKKGKADREGPSRFKKDLLTYKNQALSKIHRAIVIGTSKHPENGDVKELMHFFDKFVYVPYPNYASRLLMWRHFLAKAITDAYTEIDGTRLPSGETSKRIVGLPANTTLHEFIHECLEMLNPSALALVSEGYTGDAIARTVKTIVTKRRALQMPRRVIPHQDLLNTLSKQPMTLQDSRAALVGFTRIVTGLNDRVAQVEIALAADDKGDKGKGKGKAVPKAKKNKRK
jgi:SpoVK/Ycf46/Vps4 family AAA+-type ATPase